MATSSITRRGALVGLALAAGLGLGLPAITAAGPLAQTPATAEAEAATPKLNLNSATEEELRTIPGVGDRMLREFLEYRPYTSISQFREEIGKYVDDDQVAAYEEFVFVSIDPNASDEATLRQLPGVDQDIAAQLENARPFASDAAFLDTLGGLVSAADADAARAYLPSLAGTPAAGTPAAAAASAKLDLNTATEEQFLAIPGVGDRMVGEFIEYRPYSSIAQFRAEIGKYVDEAQVAAYEEYVFVSVAPNEADAATLQQIPGLDEATAQRLIESRPYGSGDGFVAALAGLVGDDLAEAARAYLAIP